MPDYEVQLGGMVRVTAANKDEARKEALRLASVYAYIGEVNEVGVDIDKDGWKLRKPGPSK